jgi:hypothetical protein
MMKQSTFSTSIGRKIYRLAIMGKLLSKRSPKVVQSRHMSMTRFKNDFYHRFLYKNLDSILAVTQQVKTQIERFIPADIRPPTEVLYIGAEQPTLISSEDRAKAPTTPWAKRLLHGGDRRTDRRGKGAAYPP